MRGLAIEETLDLWKRPHGEGEVEWTVGYGANVEAEPEARCVATGVGVAFERVGVAVVDFHYILILSIGEAKARRPKQTDSLERSVFFFANIAWEGRVCALF